MTLPPRPPLAVGTYLRRNLRRILPAFIMIAFIAVVVVGILSTLRGLKQSALHYTREFQLFSVALPKKGPRLSAETVAALRAREEVDRVIESRNCFLRIRTLVGWLPWQLRGVSRADMEYLMARAGTTLRAGRLPEAGTREVAVHDWLMRANGWEVGQEFGTDVSDDDWMPGRFKVVGVLEGEVPIGFASIEYLGDDLRYTFAPKLWERVLVVPKEGRLAAMNAGLRATAEVKVFDDRRAVEEIDDFFDRLMLVSDFISGLLMLVVALVVGLLNSFFFSQRMDEFAVLLALGWTRGRLLRKALGETAAISIAAWGTGVLLGLAVLALFDGVVLAPRGVFIPAVQALPILASAVLPGVAMLFGGWTVTRRLTSLDPVLIIERRG